jgi:hypothetical protein
MDSNMFCGDGIANKKVVPICCLSLLFLLHSVHRLYAHMFDNAVFQVCHGYVNDIC